MEAGQGAEQTGQGAERSRAVLGHATTKKQRQAAAKRLAMMRGLVAPFAKTLAVEEEAASPPLFQHQPAEQGQNLSVPGVLSNGVLLLLLGSLQGLDMAPSSANEVAGLQLTSQAPHRVAPHDTPLPPHMCPKAYLMYPPYPQGFYTLLPLLPTRPKVLLPFPPEFTPCFREFEDGFP
jgi:hypothetical protein